jgi:site-specific recombinase XerD
MKCVINSQIVLSQPLVGPLVAYIKPFAELLSEQGYTRYSIHRQVLLAACFSRWLKQRGIGLRGICSDHWARYLRHRARHLRPIQGDSGALSNLMDFLRLQGAIPDQRQTERRLTPVEQLTQAFEAYLLEARALARATIVNYLPFVHGFLKDRFGHGPVTLAHLCANDVVRFVQRQVPRLHLKRAKLMTTALRAFLRYTRYRGEVTLDLAAAVPIVANWSMTSIPRAISAEHVRQLLTSIDRRTPIGRRDYAVLLLLARLGLRASAVAFLELDDIDWTAGRLYVRGKGAQRLELPLPADVGKAIAAYLHHGRPVSTSRRVFLRAKAPIRGFWGVGGIDSIILHSLERAGIDAPTRGAHQFRHGLACEMLRHGASLSEIGQLLGHSHPQTTTIYAKVDLQALRTLALPWPGGVQ